MNQRAKYVGKILFRPSSKVTVQTHRQTHTRTHTGPIALPAPRVASNKSSTYSTYVRRAIFIQRTITEQTRKDVSWKNNSATTPRLLTGCSLATKTINPKVIWVEPGRHPSRQNNYATKSPLVTIGCPTFPPKPLLPLRRSPHPSLDRTHSPP